MVIAIVLFSQTPPVPPSKGTWTWLVGYFVVNMVGIFALVSLNIMIRGWAKRNGYVTTGETGEEILDCGDSVAAREDVSVMERYVKRIYSIAMIFVGMIGIYIHDEMEGETNVARIVIAAMMMINSCVYACLC